VKKGIYLVTERACFNPTTGAYRHIHTGLSELTKYYHIELIKGFKEDNTELKSSLTKPVLNIVRSTSGMWGVLRDLKILIVNLTYLTPLFEQIKKTQADFIYERAAYLNFNGLIVSKLLKISHFYEANGIQHEGRSVYYTSWFKPLAAWLERQMYSRSDFVFFVGSYGAYFKLTTPNWKNIENGIETGLINHFRELEKPTPSPKVNMCFIASLMAHHRPDVLMEALKKISNKKSMCLHLIGANLSPIELALQGEIEIVNHGFLNRERLAEVMKQMHVGLIAGSPPFNSNMKLLDYACAKCIIIAPNVYNIMHWFSETEIVFFQKGQSSDMAHKIEYVITNYGEVSKKGNRLYERVAREFTWEQIFTGIKDDLDKILTKHH